MHHHMFVTHDAIFDTNLRGHRARDGEVDVDVLFGRVVLEVDGREVLVVRLAQVERELVVDGQIVCSRLMEEGKKLSLLHLLVLNYVKGHLQKHESLAGSP